MTEISAIPMGPGGIFRFTALSFGFTSVPRIFTKLLKLVFAKLHEEGQYLNIRLLIFGDIVNRIVTAKSMYP